MVKVGVGLNDGMTTAEFVAAVARRIHSFDKLEESDEDGEEVRRGISFNEQHDQ
jgi:hypothetical protein